MEGFRNRKPPDYDDRRWTRLSNRDEDHPGFTLPGDLHDPDPGPLIAPRDRQADRPNMSQQSKRIVVVFGDVSFNMSSKGTLPCNTRDIRKTLQEKSKIFG